VGEVKRRKAPEKYLVNKIDSIESDLEKSIGNIQLALTNPNGQLINTVIPEIVLLFKGQEEKFNTKLELLERRQEQRHKDELKKMSTLQEKEGCVNQTHLGYSNDPSIGSKFMGRLLIKLKIAKRSFEGHTVPFRNFINNEVAFSRADHSYTRYLWHQEKTMELIHKRLEQMGKLEEFLKTETTKEMELFITNLSEYVPRRQKIE